MSILNIQYKACIFDLDGTVADTLDTITYFANKALQSFSLPQIEKERYRFLVGQGAKRLIENMLEEIDCKVSQEQFDKIFSVYNKFYEADSMYLTKPYNGIVDTLNQIKQMGIHVAVLSNKPDNVTQMVVQNLFGTGFFDLCYGQRGGVPNKPDPYMAEQIAIELGVNVNECLYIGDTDVDMQTGVNAKMDTIGVLWGFRDREELQDNGATYIITKPSEMVEIITKER